MLDIILNNIVIDNCDMYKWSIINDLIRQGMANGSDLTSIAASKKSALEAEIEKTLKAFADSDT